MVLRQMLESMHDLDEVNDETITRALWVADRVKAQMEMALDRAEKAADTWRHGHSANPTS